MSKHPRLRDLQEYVDRVRSSAAGIEAVEAARDLRLAAERLERMQIKAARSQGVSWSKIGAAYGLSKQGAQQRFAKRTATDATSDPASDQAGSDSAS